MKIQVGSSEHQVETRAITLIVPGPKVTERIKYPGCIELDLEACTYHATRCQVLHSEIHGYWSMVFDTPIPDTLEARKQMGSGMIHVLGLLDLSLKLPMKYPGIKIVWKYPEACLHPQAQLGLADVAVALCKS